jgi:hypothetical protein
MAYLFVLIHDPVSEISLAIYTLNGLSHYVILFYDIFQTILFGQEEIKNLFLATFIQNSWKRISNF